MRCLLCSCAEADAPNIGCNHCTVNNAVFAWTPPHADVVVLKLYRSAGTSQSPVPDQNILDRTALNTVHRGKMKAMCHIPHGQPRRDGPVRHSSQNDGSNRPLSHVESRGSDPRSQAMLQSVLFLADSQTHSEPWPTLHPDQSMSYSEKFAYRTKL